MKKRAKRARRRPPTIRLLVVTDSTNIAAVGYDKQREKLRVRFRDGSEYDYAKVSARTYAELVGAASIGLHFREHIRSSYPCERRRKPRAHAHAS